MATLLCIGTCTDLQERLSERLVKMLNLRERLRFRTGLPMCCHSSWIRRLRVRLDGKKGECVRFPFSESLKLSTYRMVKILNNERWSLAGRFPVRTWAAIPCRASEAYLCVRLRECAWRGPHHSDSYLVDPASNICLFQRLSHACLRISELIQ